jgi:hypothetical protein
MELYSAQGGGPQRLTTFEVALMSNLIPSQVLTLILYFLLIFWIFLNYLTSPSIGLHCGRGCCMDSQLEEI